MKANFPCSRIYLTELSALIKRKDKRSIRKWCKTNSLQFYKDCSGEFVFKSEFDLAYDMPLIKSLKVKFGDLWKDYYRLHKCGNVYESIDLGNIQKIKKAYVPRGKIATKIFEDSWK